LCKERNTVERCINKIKEWRGLAARYDKTPRSYEAGLHLRGAVIWLRSLQGLVLRPGRPGCVPAGHAPRAAW
jgi:hypothetical protein